MTIHARYAHTNLVARDWQALAAFYQSVFGCLPVAERDLQGKWLDDATSLSGVRIRGIHLRLPGYGDEGPTLEIFCYDDALAPNTTAPNRPGFGHIAFAVDDVVAACDAVVAAGGSLVGKIVTVEIPNVGEIIFAYAADPEGNIIEVQQWSKQ
jgi:predicted enzyme related to lactoylglutathione lyase